MSQMGRPKIENPKSVQFSIRMDKETLAQLDACAKFFDEKRSETIRRGIRNLFLGLENK